MAALTADRNAFDALCLLAAKERWCWNIVCTTCGHMHFRYALHELLNGNHPDSESWLVRQSHPVLKRGGQPKELGPLPPLGSWPMNEQRKLAKVLSCGNLQNIASECPFPDWLGYLGLGLLYSEDAERESQTLSQSWAPQLLQQVPRGSRSHNFLQGIVDNNTQVLSWRDLEAVEADLLNSKSLRE